MGWKNVKEHYRIEHIVQVVEGRIWIGSPYVPDLIIIEGPRPRWGALGPSKNDKLARYFAEMEADLATLFRLVETPDTFGPSIPVYTYKDAEIIEKQAEALGWPNVTHDGCLMYENMFFASAEEARAMAKRNAAAWVAGDRRYVAQCETALARSRAQSAEGEAVAAALGVTEEDIAEFAL